MYHFVLPNHLLVGPSGQTDIERSAAGINKTLTFPASNSSLTFEFPLTDDDVGLEAVELYTASLELVDSPDNVSLCFWSQTSVTVMDDDGIYKNSDGSFGDRVGFI